MKTLEERIADAAAQRMPRPLGYSGCSDAEWEGICIQMVEDLMALARQDGCVAAGLALAMIEAAGANGGEFGNRLPDEYSIEVGGRMLDSARTADIEGVRALLPDVLANGYADAKIVRVVTFTQEVE